MTLSIFSNFLDEGPDLLEILLRMALTFVFVGLIGLERQMRHKIAGITTHLMVAFGACGIAILQDHLYYDALAVGTKFALENQMILNVQIQRQRVIAQVVTGVGFLGAGTILKTKNGIYGLTTAATLWLASMIGLCFGMGDYMTGIVLSLFSFIFLTVVRRIIGMTSLKHTESPDIIGSERVDED